MLKSFRIIIYRLDRFDDATSPSNKYSRIASTSSTAYPPPNISATIKSYSEVKIIFRRFERGSGLADRLPIRSVRHLRLFR